MQVLGPNKRVAVALSMCAVSAAVGGVVGDAIAGSVVVVAMIAAVRASSRMKASSAWRTIIGGGLFIGLAPVFSVGLWGPWVWGDLVAFVGYGLFILGLGRAIRVRTQRLQVDVFLDAVLVVGWIFCLMNLLIVHSVQLRLDGLELVGALSYVPFTLVLMLQLFRLGFGSPDYSRTFAFLMLGPFSAALAEMFFLADTVVEAPWPRSLAVGIASAGLVMVSAAVTDPSASEFEQPSRGDFRRIDALRGTIHVTSIVLLVVVAVTRGGQSITLSLTLLALGALTSVRIYVVVKERERWIQSEREMQLLASSLLDAQTEDAVLDQAVSAMEELVADRSVASVEVFRDHEEGWVLVGNDDPQRADAEADDLDLAVATLATSYTEYSSGAPSRFVSRLVVPMLPREADKMVLVVEASPVLSPLQVSQIGAIASTVRLSLEALSARERAHQQRANHRFRALSQDSNDIVSLVRNGCSTVDMVGPTLERLLGRADEEYVGRSPLTFVHPADAERIRTQVSDAGHTPLKVAPFDVRLSHSNGRHHWFTAAVRDLRDDPEVDGLVYSFRDVNDRKMAEIQVRASEARYRALIQHSNDVFALVDCEERISYVSPNVTRLLGFEPGDLIGTDVRGLLTSAGSQTLDRALEQWGDHVDGEELILELRTNSPEVRQAKVAFVEMMLEDEPALLVTAHDVTEQLLLEENLKKQALYDSLTGVYNRTSVLPELQRALQGQSGQDVVGVMHLDIVNFSEINSSVGFDQGDQVLIEVASRLRSVIRSEDALARLDADEFVVISSRPYRSGVMLDAAASLLAVFDEPFEIGGRQVILRASLGLSSTTDRRENPTILLENAGLASRHGRAHDQRLIVFEDSMRAEATERFELAADLKANLDTDQFTIVYQPLFDLSANQVTSVEALLRWHHPTRGHVSPALFIPLAEATGAIVELGRMVLRRACLQLATWQESLPGGEHLSMAVNVSARQFEVPGEAEMLRSIITGAGVAPDKLTIELTESTFIDDAAWLREQLLGFQAMGVCIAVDDFGAGAAGLSHLRDVPFDILKIDKAYIDSIEYAPEAVSLLSGMVELAHGLNAKLVAEGIETPGQMTLLREIGCDYGQGFFLGRPMTPDALEHWIGQGWVGAAAAVIMVSDPTEATSF